MPHITETLHEDHEKVEQIFRKLFETTDGAEGSRRDLCQKLKEELLAHAEFEEEVFYPALGDGDGIDQRVKKAIEEHQEVETMLQEIEQLEPTSAQFMDKIAKLQEAVQEHVTMEEEELFPEARKAIKQDEGEEMSRRHDTMVQEHVQDSR